MHCRANLISLALCAGLLGSFYAIAFFGVSRKCATADEPESIVSSWIVSHHDDFRCDSEHPPLWKYWVVAGTSAKDMPVSRRTPLWDAMLRGDVRSIFVAETFYDSGADSDAILKSARARMTVLGVVLGIAICWWAWRLAGCVAGVVAAGAYCLDPNFLAHSPLVKNDVAIALCFVLFMASVWLVGEKATVGRVMLVALTAGVAMTTKFTGVLVIPMLGIALLFRALMARPWPVLKWSADSRGKRFVASLALGATSAIGVYFIIWAVYGFRFGPSPNPEEHFDRHWVAGDYSPSVLDRPYDWADANHVLPEPWIYGLHFLSAHTQVRPAFLLDMHSQTGWWYYFPVAMALKTPLSTLAAIALAFLCWLVWHTKPMATRPPWDWWPAVALLVAPVICMASAMIGGMDLGLRYIFPVYPFLFIFLGVIAAQAARRRPRITAAVAGLLFLGLCVETLSAYPDFIPFFNIAAGDAARRVHELGDSNLDWGQDLPDLARWQKLHPDRTLILCYFGVADPHHYGIHYIKAAGGSGPPGDLEPPASNPVLAVSATALQGIYFPDDLRQYYGQFLGEKPVAVLGGSIYLFDHLENRMPGMVGNSHAVGE
jgi:hypothetical protein